MENDNNSSDKALPSISHQQQMSQTEIFNIIRSISEDCVQEEELLELLAHKSRPICYDEFEPFGRINIAQGLLKTINVNKLTSAGCKVKILIADRVALLNNKMCLEKVQEIGKYFIEIWRAVGMNVDEGNVEFLWQSDEIKSREYWPLVTEIGRANNLTKLLGCSEQDELSGGHILHPCMQSAAILSLEADICLLGMDQRKVNELAREYCDDIKRKNKPIFLSHHVLPGLKEGQEKMSSDPSSSIYMDDEEAEVNSKIKKAFCPPKVLLKNPCLEYIKYIIFTWFNEFSIERKADNGGNKTYKSFKDLADDYESGELHPADLKPALAKALNRILQPVPKAKELRKRAEVKQKKNTKSEFSNAFSMENDNNRSIEAPPSQLLQSLLISPQPKMSEERYKIIRSIGEECIQEDELKGLLARKSQPICYDGFEPSGRMHIAQGVMKAINVNKLISAGCKVKIWIADWFAQMNNKMGGDLKKIQVIGEYFIEIWKAVGMKGQAEFLWSSDEINSRAHEYWPLVMDIAWGNTLPRLKRCCQIMGRSEQDELSGAQIFYPCMQCADIFFLKADICQLGMDQRKVNVLAREYCDDIKRKNKPIILSHHMLPGLKEGQEKMSKSDPSSSIYMEDEEAEVNLKIEKAFCPPKVVLKNPCLEYINHIIFPWFNEFAIERQADNGGNKTFKSFEDLADEYESGEVHPADLKPALAKAINRILQPVRDHFINDPNARELLKKVKSYNVTR